MLKQSRIKRKVATAHCIAYGKLIHKKFKRDYIHGVYDYKHFVVIYFILQVFSEAGVNGNLNGSHLKGNLKGRYASASFERAHKFTNTLLVFTQNVSADFGFSVSPMFIVNPASAL